MRCVCKQSLTHKHARECERLINPPPNLAALSVELILTLTIQDVRRELRGRDLMPPGRFG